MFSVAHLTSVHRRFDTRIFLKMCRSVVQAGHRTSLVVADGLGNEERDGVNIVDVGKPSGGRVSRVTGTVRRVYRRALDLNADVYHLHDPELIPLGLALKLRRKTVVFDAHEDFPAQIREKPYLKPWQQSVAATAARIGERLALPRFDAVIAATPHIASKIDTYGVSTICVENLPLTAELAVPSGSGEKRREVAYVGGISEGRSIWEMVRALEHCRDVRLNLAGNFIDRDLEAAVTNEPGWDKVNYYGHIDRSEVAELLARSTAGIVVLRKAENHLHALPTKLFEYLSAGVPIIASNFPGWKNIVDSNRCGICIEPSNVEEMAAAMQQLVDDPKAAEQMGHRGRSAVESRYNWGRQEEKLLDLYQTLLT